MEKRNYLEICRNLSTYIFDIGYLGYYDGYADLGDDSKEIINQLFGLESADFIIKSVSLYLQGYELGKDISDNIEEVYDEDGNMKEKWDNKVPLSDHVDDATNLFIKHIKKENEKIKMLRNFDKLPK